MGPENLHALFFGLSVGLAGFVVLLVLVKILRRSGVIPYPPFKSRAEYLEAALEMNLEIFIERAKATPRSITQKLPAPTFKMMDPETSNLIIGTLPTGIGGQISKDLNLTMADQESIFKAIDSMIHTFSRGLEEVVALKKVEAAPPSNQIGSQVSIKIEGMGGSLGAPGAISGAIGAAGVDAPVFSWFRLKESGALVRFSGDVRPVEFGTYEIREGKNRLVTCHRADLEPAYPRRGEWWQKRECPKIHGKPDPTVSWRYDPIQWAYSANVAYDGHGPEICAALCGCLEPINFGKGKSGVA